MNSFLFNSFVLAIFNVLASIFVQKKRENSFLSLLISLLSSCHWQVFLIFSSRVFALTWRQIHHIYEWKRINLLIHVQCCDDLAVIRMAEDIFLQLLYISINVFIHPIYSSCFWLEPMDEWIYLMSDNITLKIRLRLLMKWWPVQ